MYALDKRLQELFHSYVAGEMTLEEYMEKHDDIIDAFNED